MRPKGVWISVFTDVPRLDKWVVILKGKYFFKAKRIGTKDMWHWRLEKGERALPLDVKWWLLVPDVPEEDDGKE